MTRRATRRRLLGLGTAAVSVALAGCGLPGGGEDGGEEGGEDGGEEGGEDGGEEGGEEEGRLGSGESVNAAGPRRR